MNSGNRKGLATIIVILGLLALFALVAGCANPAFDRSKPALTWSF